MVVTAQQRATTTTFRGSLKNDSRASGSNVESDMAGEDTRSSSLRSPGIIPETEDPVTRTRESGVRLPVEEQDI